MECCDIVRNFLEGRKGKEIRVLVEGGGFHPIAGKLADFNDSTLMIEQKGGVRYLIDIDYVISVADAEGAEGAE
ncbi:MAG: hypothetical protein IPI63_07445 [Methanothrix sp.]|nr:hypothetical protein [Methanothrix sp.]MDI9417207.1 hypothetical protein [Euryarchaeota archaeon]MBK7386554.1 hypothetical protein [Methanothrix sp.]HON36721.1 hypothetical protein [Methanothrix sp.]HPW72822.1 hypothetical protein [Methanothrix sp.]HRU75976.1 hypothetical protein [Methanothrix sp.]